VKPRPLTLDEARQLSPEQRESIRSWGTEVPEPPKPLFVRATATFTDGSEAACRCPGCGIELRLVLGPLEGFTSHNSRYVRLPKSWTDDDIRWAGEQIRRRLVSRGRR
jgi:hypothetical protein